MADNTYYVIHKRTGNTQLFYDVSSVITFMWGQKIASYYFLKADDKGPRVVDVSQWSGDLSELTQILKEA
jgi:hypothetical protein